MDKKRILIVEDELIVAEDLSSVLKKMGYSVPAIARSGEEAIGFAKVIHPDLILMDIKIEGDKDGISTAERIKQELRVPVIYLTAHSDDSTLERAKLTRPSGYVVKPFRERELYAIIEMTFSRFQKNEERLLQDFGKSKNVEKLYLIDNHSITRHGLAQLIEKEKKLVLCGEAENGNQAIVDIGKLKPHMVILDISHNDINDFNLIKSLRREDSQLCILVLTSKSELYFAERALRAGANGYIMKNSSNEEILNAVYEVLAGNIYLSAAMQSKLLNVMTHRKGGDMKMEVLDVLSDRELEVFQLIGMGKSLVQIAQELFLSLKTIETHREHIKKKLHMKTANELRQFAVNWRPI